MSEHPSALPVNTREHLYAVRYDVTWYLPGEDDSPCEGARHHSPRPLFTVHSPLVRREWWPEFRSAGFVMAPKASLCGTCRDNLDILLQMLHHADGDLDWEIRREFGNNIRALAKRGWEWFEAHRPVEAADSPTKG